MSYLPPASLRRSTLGWFDIRDFGAVADFDLRTSTAGTDNGLAIRNAIKAAVDYDSAYARRNGVVYIPPAPPGKGWGVSTAIDLTWTQAGPDVGGALHIDILGCGADGPIVCNTGTGVDVLSINVAGLEWFMGSVRNVAFCSSKMSNPGTGIDCRRAMNLQASVGKWIVDELHGIGVQCDNNNEVFRFKGANFEIGTIHNAGCVAYLSTGSFIHFDEAAVCNVRGLFSYGEYNYQGIDNLSALGAFNMLIRYTPSQDSSWGPTAIRIENIHSDGRNDWAIYGFIVTGTKRAAFIRVDNFKITPSTGGMQMWDVDHIELNGGLWAANTNRKIIDAFNFTSMTLSRCVTLPGGTVPDIRGDGSGTIYVNESPVGSITAAGAQVVIDQGGRRQLAMYSYAGLPGVASSATGAIAYCNTDKTIKVNDGAAWHTVGGAAYVKGISTGYTVVPGDQLLAITATGATIPVTLPSGPTGAVYRLKDAVGGIGPSYVAHVRGPSGYTIDGSPTGNVINTTFGSKTYVCIGGTVYVTIG